MEFNLPCTSCPSADISDYHQAHLYSKKTLVPFFYIYIYSHFYRVCTQAPCVRSFFKFLDTFSVQCHVIKMEMSHIQRAVLMLFIGAP